MLHRLAIPATSAVLPDSSPLLAGLVKPFVDGIPADDVPPSREIIGTPILILEIIRVLPNVVAEDRRRAGRRRIVLVGRADDFQLARRVANQPDPAAAEL